MRTRVTPRFQINAALRSVIWLGVAAGWAYLKKPDGASLVEMRTDAIGWLGGGIVLASLILHFWSSATLARGERQEEASAPVTDGPFRYVRNPIYLAGIALLLGVGLLYSPVRAVDVGVIDGAVNGVAALVDAGAATLRRLQTGSVRTYASSLFLGVVLVLGYYLWR